MSPEKTTPDPTANPSLTWSLCICTYNRPHFLIETLRYALAQTYLPAEIVIVDGSDAWEDHRDQMQAAFPDGWKKVRMIYKAAKVRSLTFQRNQAAGLATSDIVFSLDDDIYLEPDAAERVMAIYQADPDENVAMVAGRFTDGPYDPDATPQDEIAATPAHPPSLGQRLRFWLEEQLTLDGHFVPYDKPVARGPLPAEISAVGGVSGGLINGGRTTFRRKFGQNVGWSELLRYYATHEDSDMSYRLSQYGRLVHATQAGFFHADGNESTASRFRINTIRVRNLMALHRIHSPNRLRSAVRLLVSFGKFTALYLLIDLAQKRFSFPTARAYAFGFVQVPFYIFWPFGDFPAWYTNLQEKMYGTRYKS